MSKYYIIPRKEFVEEIEAKDKEDALATFALNASDMNQYFQVVTKEELEKIRENDSDAAANKRFVTAFMKNELMHNGEFSDSFLPEDVATLIAETAYDLYCQGDGQTEYECIQSAYYAWKTELRKDIESKLGEYELGGVEISDEDVDEVVGTIDMGRENAIKKLLQGIRETVN